MIQGGAPLSGEIVAAGQQERGPADPRRLPAHRRGGGALQRAADPRHRDPGRAARAARREGRTGAARTSSASRPTPSPTPRSDEELSARIRASFLLAGPLLARFGEARMPPPGGDFIGRRRLDPHLDAFRDMGALGRGRALDRDRAPGRRPRALPDLHGRALGDGDRERADGRRADPGPDDDRERRLRAARPGPRPAAGQDGRADRRHRLERDDRPRPRQARRRRAPDLPRPHRGGELHGARRRDQGRAAGPRRRARGPDHDPAPVPPPRPAVDGRGRRRARAAGAGAGDPGRPRRRDPEDRRRPVAGVPRRPDLDRARPRHPGARARS